MGKPVTAGAERTSIDKALDVCEALSRAPRGLSVAELARTLGQPSPTVHRLLALLRRRGYVRQDEDTLRYSLTLRMLDLSFQLLGRSELRLHGYAVLREHVVRSGQRAFLSMPAAGEVTYVWATGPDEVAMRTVFGREMPAHCAIYFSPTQATRRLSCLRLGACSPGAHDARVERLGPPVEEGAAPRLCCTCAPVRDYTGREVARVGLFFHRADDGALAGRDGTICRDLAQQVSRRLGYIPVTAMSESA